MDQACNVVFVLALDWNHIAALPHGDDGFLQILGISWRRNNLLQAFAHFGALHAHMPPDIPQRGTGLIGNLFFADNSGVNTVL